jgi:tRNA (guanine-N7-)-methyltransferase
MKKASDLRIPFVWEDRRPVLLERFLYVPKLYDRHDSWVPVPWSDPAIFGNNQPVVLEYCSGNGQWICERAKQNPHLNWVALDLRFDRSRKTWLRLHRENLTNLYVLCGEANVLTRFYIPKGSISEIFINFPDPWPKLRHAKHRLIQKPFLDAMGEIAREDARATFVTDDSAYASQMLFELAASSCWRPLLPAPHFTLDLPDYGISFFSELWKKKGKNIHFLSYAFCHKGAETEHSLSL